MIYTYFESILVAEDNRKQNPKQSYITKIKNMLLAIMVKIACVDDTYSYVKMQFTILLIVQPKKVSFVQIL